MGNFHGISPGVPFMVRTHAAHGART
jgi:hypothetical protein